MRDIKIFINYCKKTRGSKIMNVISLEAIFRDVFDDEDILINVATTANDIDEWDSLAQIRLILQ